MHLNDNTIATVRATGMGIAGACCLIYAVLAIVQNRPDPLWWFIPGLVGLAAGGITAIVFALAGKNAANAASDELFRMVADRAQRHAFWIALALYPVFGLLVFFAGLRWDTTFAAMGTLTAAAYLLLFCLYEARTR